MLLISIKFFTYQAFSSTFKLIFQLVLIPSRKFSSPTLRSSFWRITWAPTPYSNLEMDCFEADIVSSPFPPRQVPASGLEKLTILFPPPSEGRTGLGRCICHPTVEKRKHTNRVFSQLQWEEIYNLSLYQPLALWSQSKLWIDFQESWREARKGEFAASRSNMEISCWRWHIMHNLGRTLSYLANGSEKAAMIKLINVTQQLTDLGAFFHIWYCIVLDDIAWHYIGLNGFV